MGEFPDAENVQVGGFSFGGTPISVRFLSMNLDELLKAKVLLKEELKIFTGMERTIILAFTKIILKQILK